VIDTSTYVHLLVLFCELKSQTFPLTGLDFSLVTDKYTTGFVQL